MKSLIIFDMDGVLIDSEPIHQQLEREIFSALGLNISRSEHDSYIGKSTESMWTSIKQRHELDLQHDALVRIVADKQLREFGRVPLSPMPGVTALIEQLSAKGLRLAIASSSPKQLIDTITSKLGLDTYFPLRVSADEVKRGKPHPDIFLRAAELCNKKPADCVVIEDSAYGLRAAAAANMASIGYANPNSGNQDLSAADLLVDDFGDGSIQRILDFIAGTGS